MDCNRQLNVEIIPLLIDDSTLSLNVFLMLKYNNSNDLELPKRNKIWERKEPLCSGEPQCTAEWPTHGHQWVWSQVTIDTMDGISGSFKYHQSGNTLCSAILWFWGCSLGVQLPKQQSNINIWNPTLPFWPILQNNEFKLLIPWKLCSRYFRLIRIMFTDKAKLIITSQNTQPLIRSLEWTIYWTKQPIWQIGISITNFWTYSTAFEIFTRHIWSLVPILVLVYSSTFDFRS